MTKESDANDEIFNYNGLFDVCRQDEEIVVKVLKSFPEQIEKDLIFLHRAIENLNFEQIKEGVHGIKGSLRLVGSDKIVALCTTIETMSYDQFVTDIHVRMTTLECLLRRLLSAIDCKVHELEKNDLQ